MNNKKITQPRHIYHIFPLGALRINAGDDGTYLSDTRFSNIRTLENIIPHLKKLGIDTLLLGPVFHSEHHGYEPVNNFIVDPRLGKNQDLKKMIKVFHKNDIKIWLDAVWNHVGRSHFAYQDLQQNEKKSDYKFWFQKINWENPNPFGDSFTVQGWNGHLHLPELNLSNPDVIQYSLQQLEYWIDEFDIDGLRIDAADVMDLGFLRKMANSAHFRKPGFFLMGEVIHGDYRNWINEGNLDSITHYEGYKSLWSSFNDENFYEIAWSLNRLFDEDIGIYTGFKPVLFNENHDVTRLASQLKNPNHLYPLHLLHYTIPGIPCLYYGEEWGWEAIKRDSDDWNLRPPYTENPKTKHPALENDIAKLAKIRKNHSALSDGSYRQIYVADRQLAFLRISDEEKLLIIANGNPNPVNISLELPFYRGSAEECLNDKCGSISFQEHHLSLEIPGNWGRILKLKINHR